VENSNLYKRVITLEEEIIDIKNGDGISNDKVKADNTDTIASYLTDKVDNSTLEVNATEHKMQIKDKGITASKIVDNLDLSSKNSKVTSALNASESALLKNGSLSYSPEDIKNIEDGINKVGNFTIQYDYFYNMKTKTETITGTTASGQPYSKITNYTYFNGGADDGKLQQEVIVENGITSTRTFTYVSNTEYINTITIS
jgi:hypothetical protein